MRGRGGRERGGGEEAVGGEAATPMATISLLNFISYIVSVCV